MHNTGLYARRPENHFRRRGLLHFEASAAASYISLLLVMLVQYTHRNGKRQPTRADKPVLCKQRHQRPSVAYCRVNDPFSKIWRLRQFLCMEDLAIEEYMWPPYTNTSDEAMMSGLPNFEATRLGAPCRRAPWDRAGPHCQPPHILLPHTFPSIFSSCFP